MLLCCAAHPEYQTETKNNNITSQTEQQVSKWGVGQIL